MTCAVPVLPQTGRLGFVGDYTGNVLTKYDRIRNWSLDGVSTPQLRVYAGTRFGTQRIAGFTEYTGSFQGWGGIPPLFVGDTFDFIGFTAPMTGVPCDPGCAHVVPAIVTSLNINWNWTAENRGVTWTANFGSTGAYEQIDDFDGPCEDDVFCEDNVCDMDFDIYLPCDPFTAVDWCNIVSANLTFTNAVASYSNNSTNCQVNKSAGNLDWTLEVVDQNPCNILTLGDDFRIVLGVDALGLFNWELRWGQVTGFSNYRIDTESTEVIGKTTTFGMQAVLCCEDEDPQRGFILDPNGVTVWPYSIAS